MNTNGSPWVVLVEKNNEPPDLRTVRLTCGLIVDIETHGSYNKLDLLYGLYMFPKKM